MAEEQEKAVSAEEWEELAQKEERAQAQQLVKVFKVLMALPEFLEYLEMLRRQVTARTGSGGGPSRCMGDVFEREFREGEVAGLRLAIELPQKALEGAMALLAEYRLAETMETTDDRAE